MLKFINKAENILSKFKNKKTKENYIKNLKKNTHEKYLFDTYDFSKNHNINIIYQNIDFIRIKLDDDNKIIKEIQKKLTNVYTYEDIKSNKTDFTVGFSNICLFNKFYILYTGLTFGNQKKLYDIYDYDKNKIGQLVLKNATTKSNKNVINSLELSGLFFKCYDSYFYNFLEYFEIDIDKQDILKRLDYCIDIKGIEVPQILNYIKPVYKKSKSVNGLTHTDKKKLEEITTDLKYGKTETFINFFNGLNDLKIYDKILDLVENYIKRKIDGLNPYQEYLNSDLPIIRIELKKKGESFANMRDNSIKFLLDNIESMFFDYLKRYFYIDLSLYIGENISLNGKKIFLAKQEKDKKILHSYIMAQAYLKNIEDYVGIDEVYKFILELYPKIKDYNTLDYKDVIEIFNT